MMTRGRNTHCLILIHECPSKRHTIRKTPVRKNVGSRRALTAGEAVVAQHAGDAMFGGLAVRLIAVQTT